MNTKVNNNNTKWTKAKDLQVGKKIAAADLSGNKMFWDEIVSIEKVGREKVWDIEVEGTRNFVGNQIIAHNTTATASAFLTNTNTAAGIVGLGIKLSSTTLDTTSRFINFLDKDGIIIGKINAANTTTVAYSANGTDMAEYFVKSNETFSPGDVVSTSDTDLTKTLISYDSKMIGIVSTAPSFVGGVDGENKVLVAIVGQVPVKISPDSPAISKGDFVTSSTIAGKATKAIRPGFVIGKALESWSPTSPTDTILVYVNNAWVDPNNSLAFFESNIASMSAEMWQYATESGKLMTLNPVQISELTVTGKLSVGLMTFDDLEASISSLTNVITIKGDLAVSGSIKVLGTSAGKAIIPAGETKLEIDNVNAATTSAIFATPEEPVLVGAKATESGKFVISIPASMSSELKVNWWIVN